MEHLYRAKRAPWMLAALLLAASCVSGPAKRTKSLKQLVGEMQGACQPHKRDKHYRARVVAIDILVLKNKTKRARGETLALTRYCRDRSASQAPAPATPPTVATKTPETKTPETKAPETKAPATPPPKATGATLAAIVKADRACAPLRRDRRFRTKPVTPIKEMTERVNAYVTAGLEAKAIRIANKLGARCAREKRRRDELAPLVDMVEQDRRRIPPRYYSLFHTLIANGRFSAAIICGEGLIRRRVDRCTSAAAGPDETDDSEPTIDDSKLSADDFDDDADDGVVRGPDIRDIGYPLNVAVLPIESAVLRTHVNLSYAYSRATEVVGVSTRSMVLAAQAQWAVGDRFQLSIMVPMAASLHSQTTGGYLWPQIVPPSDGRRNLIAQENLGNIELGAKAKIAGASNGLYALAGYFYATIPSTSRADCSTICEEDETLFKRGFSTMRGGLALNVNLFQRLSLGAGLGWIFNTIEDVSLRVDQTFDFFAALRLHRYVGLQLGMQLSFPWTTTIEIAGQEFKTTREVRAGMIAGAQVFPVRWLHVDLGVRVAFNDEGRVYTDYGRAAFVTSVGYLFR